MTEHTALAMAREAARSNDMRCDYCGEPVFLDDIPRGVCSACGAFFAALDTAGCDICATQHSHDHDTTPGGLRMSSKTQRIPRVLTLDLETLPDPYELDAALGAIERPSAEPPQRPAFDEAMRWAKAGDASAVTARIGDLVKLGNLKDPEKIALKVQTAAEQWDRDNDPAALAAAADARYDTELQKVAKDLSLDTTGSAICAFALTTATYDPTTGACEERVTYLASWGTAARETTVRASDGLIIERFPVAAPVSIMELDAHDQTVRERALLLTLTALIDSFGPAIAAGNCVVATFNGRDYDLPLLEHRITRHWHALALADGTALPGVRPATRIPRGRYETRPHLDVAQVMWDGDRSNRKGRGLETCLRRLGFDFRKPDGMNGAMVYPAAREGRWRDIEDYCLGDTVDLHDAARLLIETGRA